MKAILFHHHGDSDVLKLSDFPDPILQSGHVIVKLHAAALNHMDIFVRIGWPGLKLAYPHILGADGAGVICDLADDVSGWKIGDRVVINANLGCGHCEFCLNDQDNMCEHWHLLGETIRGTYAEYIAIPARQLFKLPEDINFQTAAAAGLVFQTAWHSLITKGNLLPEETVLIIGSSGGVCTASIQIAKYIGAKSIVIGSTTEKLALAESLGADELILRDKNEDWSKTVFLSTEKRGVDVVVDNVGTTFPQSLRALRRGGRLVTVGNTAGPKFEIDNRFIFGKHLSIIGSTMGTLADFDLVMGLITTHKLRPAIGNAFPLSEARLAHEHLESGKNLGKVILSINDWCH
jgi:NADPH:quinone reductase-like Zn-dependent oxidoreductase